MSVRSGAVQGPRAADSASAAPLHHRLDILPPGERDRRRARPDRRRADRRVHDFGAPYGAERRSGRDDRQADRRARTRRAAGIGLMRDYFSPAGTGSSSLPDHHAVHRRD
jgi:hypothetical protein